jgi:hypothetical protein
MSKCINLIGQKFNLLTVLSRAENSSTGQAKWLCQCDCGNQKIVAGYHLRRGDIKSCGCYCKQRTSEARSLQLEGQKFGNLLVIEREGSKRGRSLWKCLCDCGNTCYVISSYLTTGDTKSCGCLKSAGEQKILMILQKFKVPYETQKTFVECRNPDTNKPFFFDFYLPNLNTCIEYDGPQHFNFQTSGFFTEEAVKKIQERDNFKNNYCQENNIHLIRIPYIDYESISWEYLTKRMSEI